MHSLIKDVQKNQTKKVPEIKTGYTVRVHQKIKEGGKERVQAFEGLVIKVGHGTGVEKTITVRRIVEGIGVEKVFPVYSPNITKIEVKKKAKVRRAKLYYMRQRSGKSARLQERHVTEAERAAEEAKMDAMIEEAVKAEEKRKAEEAKLASEAEGTVAEKAEGESSDQPDAPEADTPAPEAETETSAKTEEPESDEGADKPTEGAEEAESEPEAEADKSAPAEEDATDKSEEEEKPAPTDPATRESGKEEKSAE